MANCISDGTFEMPLNAIGMVFRVVTFANTEQEFSQKVARVLQIGGLKLISLEDSEKVSDFLKHDWVAEDHEVFEIQEQAEKILENVVCGTPQYYTHNDA